MALITDAGTPLISDPGYKLVREARAVGVLVTTVPGPSAVLAALTIAGLPTDRFFFAGFLPNKAQARATTLASFASIPGSLVFFESAKRLGPALAAMATVLGPREAAVTRELTKLHEEVRSGTLATLAAHYADAGPPRGEVVVVVGPPEAKGEETGAVDIGSMLDEALAGQSLRDAVDAVATASGRPRREVYQIALSRTRQ